MVQRVTDVLNEVGLSVRGSRILLIGAAHKPNVSDIRESPGVAVAERLVEHGARVRYVNPHVEALTLHDGTRLPRVDLGASALGDSDLVLITTRHDSIDGDLSARALAARARHPRRTRRARTRGLAHPVTVGAAATVVTRAGSCEGRGH